MNVLRRLRQPGASYATVAHDLGISEGRARKRVFRLLERLRAEGYPVANAWQAWEVLKRRERRVEGPPMDSLWKGQA
jgi:hypothetical protein